MLLEAGHPNRARLDAYIARRVLEEAELWLEACQTRHPMQSIDFLEARIAVIKKGGK